jgi:hypothetical protein
MSEEYKKKKSQGFAAFGIPVGATLVYKKDPSIMVKTLDDRNKVEYQGKPYSISTLAKQLVGSPVSGYLYFKYGDKVIKSLGKPETQPSSPLAVNPAPATSAVSVTAESSEAPEFAEDSVGVDIDPPAGMDTEEDSTEFTPDAEDPDAEEEE